MASAADCEKCTDRFKIFNKGCITVATTCPYKFYDELSAPIRCERCHISCGTCSNALDTGCITCEETYYRLGGLCVQDCGAGLYRNDLTTTCDSCAPTCGTGGICVGGGPNDCIACGLDGSSNQMFLAADLSCVSTCGDGMWGEVGPNACRDCEPGCRVCTGNTFADCVNDCPIATPNQIRGFSWPLSQCLVSCPDEMYSDPRKYC